MSLEELGTTIIQLFVIMVLGLAWSKIGSYYGNSIVTEGLEYRLLQAQKTVYYW